MSTPFRTYEAHDSRAPMLVLGHGAGAGHDHPWMKRVARGLADRGIHVITFNFPYMEARRKVPDKAPALEEAFQSVWTAVATQRAKGVRSMFAGGKSMGGRIASQAAAKGLLDPQPSGLAYFGYPLHPPGKPDARRDRHLPDITRPMLFLHGTRDPFGSPDEMTTLVATLGPVATLAIVEGGDHSLQRRGARSTQNAGSKDPAYIPKAVASDGLDAVIDRAADWIKQIAHQPTA